MWVLNIYPNTGSNIVGAEKRRQWAPLEQAEEGGERDGGFREGMGEWSKMDADFKAVW